MLLLEKRPHKYIIQKEFVPMNAIYSQLKGQVNPLNPEDAGPIAYLLSKYRGGKLNLVGSFKLEK